MTASTADRTTASEILGAIAPLVEAGLCLHWLHPRSKRPIGDGWQNACIPTFADLQISYRQGNNLGVRLGEPSRVSGGWLHAIDMDIRDRAQAADAWAALRELLPIDPDTLPSVISGSGGESRHLYFVCDQPLYGRKLAVSEGKHRDKDGRWRYDWEVELFGTGKQVALPPSIHPDTLKPYRWERPLDLDAADLGLSIAPIIPAERLAELAEAVTDTFDYESIEPLTFRPGQLEAELDVLPDSRLDDYHDWVALGMALHHQFGASERGFALWLQHSKRSEKFAAGGGGERDMRAKWRGFGRSRRAPVTMASVRLWAMEARRERTLAEFDDVGAFDDEVGTSSIAPAQPAAATPALDDDDLLGGMPFDPPADDIDAAGSETRTAIDWTSLLDLNEKGAIKATLHNAELIIKNDPRSHGLPAFNELTQSVVYRREPGVMQRRRSAKPTVQLAHDLWKRSDKVNGDAWGNPHDRDLRRVITAPKTQGGYGMNISERDFSAAVDLVARGRSFHPIREYLETLAWDGTSRCDGLFIDYLGADDNAYTRSIARLMLVAAVARIYEPGHKFDHVVILEGPQGTGKSTFIRVLGKSWFAELEGDFGNSQQMLERIRGNWILEIPELAGFNRADVRSLKAFVSRLEDRARLPYEPRVSELKRQCILIGSTNEANYLLDGTGNRRWWPVKCTAAAIDTKKLATEIDQVWAEAVQLYRQMRLDQPMGELPLYLADGDAAAIASEVQESRRIESPEDVMAGQIEMFLQSPKCTGGFDESDGRPRYVTCSKELWHECLGYERPMTLMDSRQVGAALSKVSGWVAGAQHRFHKYGPQRAFWREGHSADVLEMVDRPSLRVVSGE